MSDYKCKKSVEQLVSAQGGLSAAWSLVGQTVTQADNEIVNQSISLCVSRPVSQSTSQSVTQPDNEIVSQSISLCVSRPVSPSVSQSHSQTMS